MMKVQQVVVLAALITISMTMHGCALYDHLIAKFVSPTAISGFIHVNGSYAAEANKGCDGDLQMSNITANIWWPGCGMMSGMNDFDTCSPSGCVRKTEMQQMNAFNQKYGGQLVTYTSRVGTAADNGTGVETVQLTGWWLPAPNATKDTPRIVIQHGFTSNSNKFRQMFVAYLLRKLGFSVLVNNLRDHCYSQNSKKGMVGWGHAYPLDELGAWDFAKDQAAEPIDASKVGILGFSMGGFTTSNAFGLDGNVPAAWIDGAPLTPKIAFTLAFKTEVQDQAAAIHEGLRDIGADIADYIGDDVWDDVIKAATDAGVDLNKNLPEEQLPKGPDTKRPVFVTANKQDGTVAYSNGEALVAFLKKYPEKYNPEFWTTDGSCVTVENEYNTAHCVDMMTHSEEYEAKLCKFWSGVFHTDPTCGHGSTSGSTRLYDDDEGPMLIATKPNPTSSIAAAGLAVAAAGLFVAAGRRMRSPGGRDATLVPDEEDLVQVVQE